MSAVGRAEITPWDLIRIIPAWESDLTSMEFYAFFRGLFMWTVVVAALWPLNVPMLALAFKIQNGAKRLPMDREQLWWRAVFGALFLALAMGAFVILDYLLVSDAEFPPGPIHLMIFAGYIPVAAWILYIMFAHADPFDGFGLFIIYVYLPVFVLFLANKIVGWFDPLLSFVGGWIKPVS